MKAYVLHDINDLRYEEVPKPEPGYGEVLLRVGAVGICGSDIPRIYKTGAHVHPLVPGHEFSGIVEKTGQGSDDSLVGKRTGVFPLIPCRKCAPCLRREYELCRNYNYIGSRTNGAFAEYVIVPCDNLLPIPDEVTMEAAAMMEPMAVAVHAMRRAMPEVVRTDRTVIIYGMGTIGLLLSAFLLDAGIDADKLYVIGNKDFQKKKSDEIGILPENFFDIRNGDPEEWIEDKTLGMGADISFDCVGKNETVKQAIDHASPSGQVVLLGNPYSDMILPKDVYWKILRNQLRITGTWNSSFTDSEDDDWHYVLDRLSRGNIHPEKFITHRFSLQDLHKGIELMRDKKEPYVKVMGINFLK